MVDLDSGARTVLAIILCVYLLALFGISLLTTRKVANEEDYLVAGRKLPLLLCWGSLIAAWFGAATVNAASEQAYFEGIRGVILEPIATSATLVLTGFCFAAPLWRMKLLTVGDFFRRTYGPATEFITAVIQVPVYFGWIALQYKALAEVQQAYFGIPFEYGVLIAFGITLAYTLIGGMWSVTVIDTIQILIAFAGLIILAVALFGVLGDGSAVSGVNRVITRTPPEMLTFLPAATSAAVLAYLGNWTTGLLGCIPGQDLQQRIYSAKNETTAVWTCVLAGVFFFLFGMIPVSIGLLARQIDPDLTGNVLQYMAANFLSPQLSIVFVVSFVAIVISTTISAVLAPATILAHNLLGRFTWFHKRALLADRLSVIFMAASCLALAYSRQTGMELLDLTLSLQLVGLFVPLLFGLYGRPVSGWSAILSILCGSTVYVAIWAPTQFLLPEDQTLSQWVFLQTGSPILTMLAEVPGSLYGLVASLGGYWLGQWLFRHCPPINDETLAAAWGSRPAPSV